jgi:integrase
LRERLQRPIDRKPTIKDICDDLIADYEIRGKGVYKMTSHLRPVLERLGHLKAADVDEDTINRYQRHRLKFVANGTVNRECQLLGQALNKIAYPKIIARPIVMRKLPENQPRQDFFEPHEVEELIKYLPDYLQDYVRFAWYSGWRKNEISSLIWDNVYPRSREIRLHPENSKNGEPRLLVLTDELLSLIDRRQQQRLEGCPYVFHRRGEFIRDFRKAWYHATAKAGCTGKVFHALRRSSARDRIRAGVHERVVMSVNGWKTRSVFDRYNITNTRDIQDALERTERYRREQAGSFGDV